MHERRTHRGGYDRIRSRFFAAGCTIVTLIIVVASNAAIGIVPPKHGGRLPGHIHAVKHRIKDSFLPKHGWIERRNRQLRGDSDFRSAMPRRSSGGISHLHALSGRLHLPVVLGLYSDLLVEPFPYEELDKELFTGPWPTGTLSEYYAEVSYGLFEVAGDVYDWTRVSNVEGYYTGGRGGVVPGLSRTGEFIKEIADALDPSVDFGTYDNDGPDGVPNSGDDDGFVDALIVVHPTRGAECNRQPIHFWSHSWIYSRWDVSGGEPYETDDPAAGGGVIRIEDYIIAPALSCDNGMIEIGVYCHELGHAIGLPDLYDGNGGSQGIGYWGLMGAGNWNTPASPAHLCAWSREQMGWLDPIEVDWREQYIELNPIGSSGEAVKLVTPTRRFRRRSYSQFMDAHALIIGYTEQEAGGRSWPGGAGYGNGWDESMIHEFNVDGTRPVTLQYDVSVDVEPPDQEDPSIIYDFGMVVLECNGAVDTLALYTATMSTRETIDLGDHLPVGPCDFVLRLRFISDWNVSDEDFYDSQNGWTFNIDNVVISGGGIEYNTDFEEDSGGWRLDSKPAEYFLIENRRRVGFDQYLPGQGLCIWHAESSTAHTYVGNSGGSNGSQARGLVLEEADAQFNLLRYINSGGNFGDTGDPFPGVTGNSSFNAGTDPSSRSNSGLETPVSVMRIYSGAIVSAALFRAGMPAPEIISVQPDSIDTGQNSQVVLDIRGSLLLYGATCYLSNGLIGVAADENNWLGEERIIATFSTRELVAGRWDVAVVSGDGQEAVLDDAVIVESIFLQARVESGIDNFRLVWLIGDPEQVPDCLVYRSERGGGFELITPEPLSDPFGEYEYRDYAVVPETEYSYRIVARLEAGGEESLLLGGPFHIEKFPFILFQNYPNPFGDRTTVTFFVPSKRTVSIKIYNVVGKRVADFGTEVYARGTYSVDWEPDRDRISMGMYFCVLEEDSSTKVLKMVLVR